MEEKSKSSYRAVSKDDLIDFQYLYGMARRVMVPIIDHYFRGELIGAEKIPVEGPAIMASNHSGNALPFDAMVLDGLLWRQHGLKKEHKYRPVYAPSLSRRWWMRPFGMPDWWRRVGGVDMKFANFDKLLQKNQKVIYYPEGIPGIGKGFTRRYRLQHFHSSFVVLAARHHVPVYPTYSINAEWINPISITFKWLDKISDKVLGLPFFPLPLVFLALIFPFVFYLAFPAKLNFVIGDAIDVRQMIRDRGGNPDEPKRSVVTNVAEEVRRHMQQELGEYAKAYGQQPYRWGEWWQHMKSLGWKSWRSTPLGWPVAFVRQERDQKRPPAKNKLTEILRDLDLLAYYLPFGWLLIVLFKKLRKPPYGVRGLTKEERREYEGNYLWNLD